MRLPIAFLLLCGCGCAQDVGITVVSSGTTAAFTSPYQFPDTPVGEGNSVVLRLQNATKAPMEILTVLVSTASGSTVVNPNFTVTGESLDKTLAADASSYEDVTVSFSPATQGAATGYLTLVYELQENRCVLASTTAATQCTALTTAGGTLQGSAIAPALVVSYAGANGPVQLQPFGASPFNFGNISLSSNNKVVFTLTNATNSPMTAPSVALQTTTFGSSGFALDTSALPAVLAAGGPATFSITFEPGQVGQTSATLTVGSLTFPLVGTGAIVQPIDALQIYYVDSQGVRTLPQAASPISFGQIVAGTTTSNVLTFTVTNPLTSLDPVPIPALSVTGTGFGAAGLPKLPETLPPGQSFTFTITFSGGPKGNYSGTLALGTRTFMLAGLSIASLIPQATLQVDVQPLTSQLQAHLSIQFAAKPLATVVGELTMTFAPSVANVSDDPAILFLATNGRQLQVSIVSGAQNATFNGQTALAFQTGTTAGTITFTLTFPNSVPVTASFPIAPQQVSIIGARAVRQDPYLVVTLTGFDNTYSAGKLVFNFSDINGKTLTATPITVDATAAFSQYFFQNNQAGGAFSLQAKFPVTGAVADVGSVTAQVTNGQGTSTSTETFE